MRMTLSLSLCLICLAWGDATAADWPHLRGPRRSDVTSEESGFERGAWKQLDVRWRANVGEGSSAPLIADGRLYALGWSDGRDTLHCLDAATGEVRWRQSYPQPRYGRFAMGDQGLYSGPSSTPEFDPRTGRIYTLGVDGDLQCWDARQGGQRLWGFNLHERYDVPRRPKVGRSGRRDYGYTTAPLLYKDWLLVEVGAKEGNLIAFHKTTGKELWRSDANEPPGHTGALALLTVGQVPCVAVMTHFGLNVYRLDDDQAGRRIGHVPWETEFSNNIAAPATYGNSVLITSGYNRQKLRRVDVSLEGAKTVWEIGAYSKVCTPVIHSGRVYWAWRQVHCVDFETGKPLWAGPPNVGDAGSLIYTGDDRLILWSDRGRLALLDSAVRSQDAYHELARHEKLARDDVWPHSVLADGRLHLRDRDGNLTCISLR